MSALSRPASRGHTPGNFLLTYTAGGRAMGRAYVEPLRVIHPHGPDAKGLRVRPEFDDRVTILRIEPGGHGSASETMDARAELEAVRDALTRVIEGGEIHPAQMQPSGH